MLHTATLNLCDGGGPMEVDAGNYRPDWSKQYTIQQMEDELAPFKFKGPGWYITQGTTTRRYGSGQPVTYQDSLLVIPLPMHDERMQEQIFLVCCWNNHLAMNAFKWIAEAPVLVDERDSE